MKTFFPKQFTTVRKVKAMCEHKMMINCEFKEETKL